MAPTRGSSIQRQIRMATIGGVAHGTRSRTRLIVCRPYLRTVPLVRRNASASPSTMRTVTPMTVSQTTVFEQDVAESPGLSGAPNNYPARPIRHPSHAEQAEVGEAVGEIVKRRVKVKANERKKNVGNSMVATNRRSPFIRPVSR